MIIDALNMRMETEIPGGKTQDAGTGSVSLASAFACLADPIIRRICECLFCRNKKE